MIKMRQNRYYFRGASICLRGVSRRLVTPESSFCPNAPGPQRSGTRLRLIAVQPHRPCDGKAASADCSVFSVAIVPRCKLTNQHLSRVASNDNSSR